MRDMEKRTDEAVALARDNPAARWIGFARGNIVLRENGQQGLQTQFAFQELLTLEPDVSEAVLLGHLDGMPVCAVPLGCEPDAVLPPLQTLDIRSLYSQGLTAREELAAVAQASGMLSWHATHKYCGRCSGKKSHGAGRCQACLQQLRGQSISRRTDPVVIMLYRYAVIFAFWRGGPHFPEGMISCLAGFMEPGETIEEAVRRETLEEAGVFTGRVSYHASQPWPFPHSLMIGCYAQALSEEIALDHSEN